MGGLRNGRFLRCGKRQAHTSRGTKEGRGSNLKKVNWVLLVLVLVGFVIGRFIGTYFEGTFLNYGQSFGMNEPVVLNLGFIILTFGLTIQITIASVIGVVIALVVYRFIR